MIVDVDKIIADTARAFESSKDKLAHLPTINHADYTALHSSPLVPLDIKIDVDQFHSEIQEWDHAFQQWGTDHLHLPRYGAALVNQTGELLPNDPINGSLMAWSIAHPDQPILEVDCRAPTSVMRMQSLSPLNAFDGYWCRSNIFKWHGGAHFKPHIDSFIPAHWFRLWGTTDTGAVVRFAKDNKLEAEINVEAGRIYLIDTTLVHDAYYDGPNTIYHFFLSLIPDAKELLRRHIAI